MCRIPESVRSRVAQAEYQAYLLRMRILVGALQPSRLNKLCPLEPPGGPGLGTLDLGLPLLEFVMSFLLHMSCQTKATHVTMSWLDLPGCSSDLAGLALFSSAFS